MRITANDVRKEYGSVTALDGLSIEIPDGSTFGVLGTNGAGKTTLFKLLVGLDRPDGGRLAVGEQSVADAGTEIRERVGYLPERVGFPGALTGREVLSFHARMRGLPRDGRIDDAIETVGLSPSAADRAVSGYSNGMRRRLGLAAAILPEPQVLVLDEPTAGLDPRGVAEFHGIIDRVRTETGATVVLSSHVLSEIERLCDRVAILDGGRVVTAGPVSELVDTDDVTVRIRPEREASLESLTDAAEPFGTVSTANGAVSVRCPAGDVPPLFAAVDSAADIVDVTVERESLEAAFHGALNTEVNA
ncbi:ABC transporter ATP-binding protein [Natronomonas gomsonensis]|uniref:ABC transporter ATP-binding protein n=1 Tax=Natronomonas gomsonensis TaxID=1046043 RepID=UPI0020CA870E|nr:ABC transporter ATP-binding protein [Natronomonas gomsonensis]MCY4731332.1 ABC transporter ATP-binding protein [Natronomonas gomsonensis]